jgi:hypothetical protein
MVTSRRAVDVKQVSRELGVRYVLEGLAGSTSGHVRNAPKTEADSVHQAFAGDGASSIQASRPELKIMR